MTIQTDDTSTTITPGQLERALALRDLTDPTAGAHAIQHIVTALETALAGRTGLPVRRDYGSRIVSVADNYDRLRFDADAVTRDRRYSRYLDAERMLDRQRVVQGKRAGLRAA